MARATGHGLASGLINTSQQVGGALGLAILAAIANSVIGATETPDTLVEGVQAENVRSDRLDPDVRLLA